MTKLTLSSITKIYEGSASPAVQDMHMSALCGEMVAIVGPSGCGKSSLLNMIAGLSEPSAGDILFDDVSVLSVPAHKRGAVLMFQDHLLFPHLTVAQNIGFGLKMAGKERHFVHDEVARFLKLVRLEGHETKMPDQLSGGQQQRVALARALITRPNILLLDEPLSNLDPQLRTQMRALISVLQKDMKVTTLFVTHDREEAVSMGDKIAVMFNGSMAQFGTVQQLYAAPKNPEIAKFLGFSPPLKGHVYDTRFKTEGIELDLAAAPAFQGPAQLVVRPENWCLVSPSDPFGINHLSGELADMIHLGDQVRLVINVHHQQLQCLVRPREMSELVVGHQVQVHVDPQHAICLPA